MVSNQQSEHASLFPGPVLKQGILQEATVVLTKAVHCGSILSSHFARAKQSDDIK
jgi:hypothetical protein